MVSLRFLPAGRSLRKISTGNQVVANCVVLNMKKNTFDNFPILYEALQLQECWISISYDRTSQMVFHILGVVNLCIFMHLRRLSVPRPFFLWHP